MQPHDNFAPSSSRPQRPRIGAGIFTSVLVAPLVLLAGFFAWEGAVNHSVIFVLIGIASLLFCIAIPAHFFIGHRVVWLLPAVAGTMGFGGACAGFVQMDWRLVRWSLTFLIVGLGWFIPHKLPNLLRRWIAISKTKLKRDRSINS